MSSVPVVKIIDALTVVGQLIQLIQVAQANGQTVIPASEFDAVVSARNAALDKLDADIAARKGEEP